MTATRSPRAFKPVTLVRLILPLLLFWLAAFVYLQRAQQVGYNTDEGQHIATAKYFEIVFVDRQLDGPAWDVSYWTLTQPSLPRYILGAGIWLSGNPIPPLNLEYRIEEARGPDRERYWDPRTYANERRVAEDRRIERPRPAVLAAARVPMALLGAGAVVLAYRIASAVSSPVGGLAAALGLLAAPLGLTLLPRAHAEAPLLFFLLLALYLAVIASAMTTSRAALATWTGSGIAAGLAVASKLTAILGLAALAALAAWSALSRIVARPPSYTWPGSALAVVLGLVVCVAVNPFLWPAPVERTLAMLEFRQQEQVGQRALNAEDALPDDLGVRAAVLLRRTFVAEAPLARRTDLPLDAVLAFAGAVVLAARALRRWRSGGLVGPEAFLLAWTATILVGTAPNLGLDWQRYYLPTVALGLVLAGVGVDAVLATAWRLIRVRRRAARASVAAPPPITTARSGSVG